MTSAARPELAGSIDKASPVPYYFQLRQLLEQQIRSGAWSPGDQLPSEPVLSARFSLSRTTVRQALDVLEQEGLIRKEKGRGAFVARSQPGSWLLGSAEGFFEDEVSRRGVKVESTVLHAAVEPLPAWAAELLELPPGSDGVILERLRRMDGQVAIYVVNYVPRDLADAALGTADDPTASLYVRLREQYGLYVAGSSRVLEGVSAKGRLGRLLEVPDRYPLVHIESVSWDVNLRRFDCYRAWLRTDRTRIVVETQARPSVTGGLIETSRVAVTGKAKSLGTGT
jgi:GntR family transcriptional regulator